MVKKTDPSDPFGTPDETFSFGDGMYDGKLTTDGDTTPPPNVTTRRRTGVSAEPILPQDAENFVPRVVVKSEELTAQLRASVASNPLFVTFETNDLNRILNAMEREEFPRSTTILTQGLEGLGKFFFITKGKVEIVKGGIGVVASFGAGQGFGELELMYNTKCAATVRVVPDAPLETYSLDCETYRNTIMMASIRKRRQHVELLRGVTFLAQNLTEYELVNLADAVVSASFVKGDKVVEFGSHAEWMHIILKGTVTVFAEDKHEVCTLKDNECIGELEFMHDHAAVADVVVSSDTLHTVKINQKHFEMAMGPIVDVQEKNAMTAKYEYYNGFSFGLTVDPTSGPGPCGKDAPPSPSTPAMITPGRGAKPRRKVGVSGLRSVLPRMPGYPPDGHTLPPPLPSADLSFLSLDSPDGTPPSFALLVHVDGTGLREVPGTHPVERHRCRPVAV